MIRLLTGTAGALRKPQRLRGRALLPVVVGGVFKGVEGHLSAVHAGGYVLSLLFTVS